MKHEINLYGEIANVVWADGDYKYIDLEFVTAELSALSVSPRDEVLFNIHSLGGDVNLAFSIYNKIRRFGKENKVKLTTRIDGYCASAGVILLLAGDKRIGNKYAEPFVHNAWTLVMGDKNEVQKVKMDLEKVDNLIAQLYEDRTNITKEKALEFMNGDTFISAQDCLDYGFYTELENDDKVVNSEKEIIFNSFKNTRNKITNNKMPEKTERETLMERFFNLFKDEIDKPKNAMLYTDKNEEVVFAELDEGVKPKVGDKATINGKNASGTVNMADGSVYEFEEDGKVKDIKEKEDTIDQVTLNSINAKIDGLIAENSNLKSTIETQNSTISAMQGKLGKYSEMETTFNSLKTIVGEYGAGIQNEPVTKPETEKPKNRFENFKLKK